MIGDVLMKKLTAVSLSVVLTLASALTVFGASSNVKITNNLSKNTVSFSYAPDKQATITRDITPLMTNLKNLTDKNSITQEIRITSESVNATPVKFYLRLEKPTSAKQLPVNLSATPTPDALSVFDYYNLLITTTDGEVVYNYKDAKKTDVSDTYKDIELLTLNYYDKASESKTYDITVSVNNDAKDQKKDAQNLKWEIVTDGYTLKDGATPSPKPSDAPVQSTAPNTIDVSNTPVAITPNVTAAPKEATLSTGTYIVGENIDSGRYLMSGNGGVKVYTKDGYLKSNIKLTTEDNSDTAVKNYVINLLDNETVEVDGNVKLEPYTPSKTTPAPVATAKATAKTTQRPAVTPKVTIKPAQSLKANPKTGDSIPVFAVIMLAFLSIMAVAYIEYRKRKNN